MPGVLAGLLSVLMVLLAGEETYGDEMYEIFPRCDPAEGLQARTVTSQALMQLAGLALTLATSVILGLLVGAMMSLTKLCDGLPHHQLFDDELYWHLPDNDNAGFHADQTQGVMRRRSRVRSSSVGIEKDKHFSAIAEIGVSETVLEPDHLQAPNTYLP